jgi:hypothetical protein
VISYVKDEGGNLLTMTTTLISMVSCQALGLTTPFVGACWGQAMSKCCKYAIDHNKVSSRLIVSIKKHNQFCRKLSLGRRGLGGTSGIRHA